MDIDKNIPLDSHLLRFLKMNTSYLLTFENEGLQPSDVYVSLIYYECGE